MSSTDGKYLKRPQDFSYDLKRIGAEEFDLLVPLMKDCFGMDADIDYFRWKYVQNPAGSFIGFVAVDTFTKEVGAYYGVIPQLFMLDGNQRTIYQSCDTMTHSNHRRRGLFQKLATHCYDELRNEQKLFVIGFGGGQSTPGFLKFGWRRIFDFRYYFRPAQLCRFSQGTENIKDEIRLHKAEKALEAGLDVTRRDLTAKAKAVRTEDQIRWRLRNPNHQYLALHTKSDDKSYIIFYVDKDKLVLFDIGISKIESGKTMMKFLNREVVKKGFKGIIAFCMEHGTDAKTLRQLGFWSNPFSFGPLNERVPFILYSNEEEMDQYMLPSDWTITTYDHDSL
ncbi:MAG: hypothetical protein RL266_1339 [Bacteroidota bacterium]|jgi:hypothetical protein